MKYVDEFREPAAVAALVRAIRQRVTRRWTVMEVCGGQTHALLKSGLADELADVVELLHGPGCPVCVTAVERIDAAIALARRPGVVLAAFGDMLRVPGSRESLAAARAGGAAVRPVYSPLDALAWAQQHPGQQVVFFAVGFETTAPAAALALLQAERLGVQNFSLLAAQVRVQPAMEALVAAPDCAIAAFLAAGHVCTVLGYESYQPFCERFRTPVVVTGFEPYDLARGMLAAVEQLERGERRVENCYGRAVQAGGNPAARRLLEQVFEPCDRVWRGFGVLPGGGLRVRREYAAFDAEVRFGAVRGAAACAEVCRGGEVLAGKIKPTACAAFGRDCTPDRPLGAPMVSSEGACAAYYHYRALGVAPAVAAAEAPQ